MGQFVTGLSVICIPTRIQNEQMLQIHIWMPGREMNEAFVSTWMINGGAIAFILL